jgi:NMD protein affecting ribosome stability and mRNA decay
VRSLLCVNCGASRPPKLWEGLPVCENCYKIVDHAWARARRETDMMLSLYREALRESLASGNLRPPVLPGEGEKNA